jgi:hypothetical protein
MFIQSETDSKFVVLDQIYDIQSDAIKGRKTFDHSPAYLAIEACAQLGAFHIRFDIGFCRHVFLINVKAFNLCPSKSLNGQYIITGNCLSRSSDAFLYAIQLISNAERSAYKGNFLFGVADYDERFDQHQLSEHYQNLFSDLYVADFVSPKPKGVISNALQKNIGMIDV